MAGWTCRKCRKVVPSKRYMKCPSCGRKRPATKRPAHMKALDYPYDYYVQLNGGEFCGECKQAPGGKRLDRDHDHSSGLPRGLLCKTCNRLLTVRLEKRLPGLIEYLRKHEERNA